MHRACVDLIKFYNVSLCSKTLYKIYRTGATTRAGNDQ